MKNYLLSEMLKTKRTGLRKAILVVPLFCSIIAILFSYMGNSPHLSFIAALNHWSLMWMPALMVITAGQFHRMESKSTRYGMIKGFPIDVRKSWIAKNLIIMILTLLATVILGVIMTICQFFLLGGGYEVIPLSSYMLALLFSWLLTLWEIPLFMYLSLKVNYLFLLILSFGVHLEFGAIFAAKETWWISPFSYALRVQAPLLFTHPNGILLEEGNRLLNPTVIPIAILAALLLVIILSTITTNLFLKQEVN